MEETIDKPMKKKSNSKDIIKPKTLCEKYYYFLFIVIIVLEIILGFNSSKKYIQEKKIFKNKHKFIVDKKSTISKLLNDIEKIEQEIKIIEANIIPKNNNEFKSYKKEQFNLLDKNKNLSELIHQFSKEYEKRIEIFEDEIIEKNKTIKQLYNEMKNKSLIRINLEDRLDLIEDSMTEEISYIKIKSSILESNENLKNLLIKWLTASEEKKIKKIKSIFSAVEHDFDSFSFHEICGEESIENTLIIIKTDNNEIVGGFTYASWRANSLISYDEKAFVFNLKKQLKIRVSDPSYAINSKINDGPIFGKYDLIINLNKIKVQEKMESYGDKDLGIGNNVLKIINYEVFTIIFE